MVAEVKGADMKIDRTDTVGQTIYVMTEKHRYKEVLSLLRDIEPKTRPIKDVTVEKNATTATGYKVPSTTGSMDQIIKVLKNTEPLTS